MLNIESMKTRYQELEQIAINAPDAASRYQAQSERNNLFMLLKRHEDDQFKVQAARIAKSEEHAKKVDEVMEALAEADNGYSQIPQGDYRARDAQMAKITSLRLQLDRLQTFGSD